jgi:hypothetical protein
MRKPLYLVMGKVIQQRHIAAMVLGKFIHKGEITIFHCHDHKIGEEREEEELEREKERSSALLCIREGCTGCQPAGSLSHYSSLR